MYVHLKILGLEKCSSRPKGEVGETENRVNQQGINKCNINKINIDDKEKEERGLNTDKLLVGKACLPLWFYKMLQDVPLLQDVLSNDQSLRFDLLCLRWLC